MFAMACAVAWSLLDALRKRLSTDYSPATILFFISAGQLPLHAGLLWNDGGGAITLPFLFWTSIAATLTLTASLLLIRAVQIAPLSLTIPYLSLTPVATLLFGWLLLGQSPEPVGLIGVITVSSGALLLNASASEWLRDPLHGIRRERGSQLMILVALLFAASTAVDRRAILHASEPLYALVLNGLIAIAVLIPRHVRQELRRSRTHMGILIAAGFIGGLAMLFQFFSYRSLFVAYVEAIKRAGGNFLALGLGVWFFGEKPDVARIAAALLMSLGVALILI